MGESVKLYQTLLPVMMRNLFELTEIYQDVTIPTSRYENFRANFLLEVTEEGICIWHGVRYFTTAYEDITPANRKHMYLTQKGREMFHFVQHDKSCVQHDKGCVEMFPRIETGQATYGQHDNSCAQHDKDNIQYGKVPLQTYKANNNLITIHSKNNL